MPMDRNKVVLSYSRNREEVVGVELCNTCCKETNHIGVITRLDELRKKSVLTCSECGTTFTHVDYI